MTSAIDAARFAELQATAGADFVVELIGTFLVEAPGLLAELRAARAAGDADGYRRAAHSLKSNGNTFGASRFSALARDLELGALVPETAPVDALAAEYERVAVALKEACRG